MKKNMKSITLSSFILAFALTFIGCSENEEITEEIVNTSEVITATQLRYADESEQMADEIAEIAEDVYVSDELGPTFKSGYQSDFLPECVVITTTQTETTKKKTIDFGEGCELHNGNVLSGKIILSYTLDMEAASKTIALTLENFTFNAVTIDGGASILRERSNDHGNPQSTAIANYQATWPDGESASFSANRNREWIAGFGSGFWGDNVFLITGNGTFVNKAGLLFSKEITTPLRREMSCRFIVSGVLEITRDGAIANLDFGDGSCDAKGILTTPDGDSQEILLRRFFNK